MPSCDLDAAAFQEHEYETNIPPTATVFEAIKTTPPLIELHNCETYITEFPTSMDFSDKLFFIQYTPENTMR